MLNGTASLTSTKLYTTPYTYHFVQPGLQILPNILCIDKAPFTLYGIQIQAPFTLGKGKAIPVQAWTGHEGSRSLMIPDLKKSAHEGGKVLSLEHQIP